MTFSVLKHLFADVLQLVNNGLNLNNLIYDFENLSNWSNQNCVLFNLDKGFSTDLLTAKKNTARLEFGEDKLKNSNEAKDLGLTLNWSVHIRKRISKALGFLFLAQAE